jgi:DNA invertase Pin-like site-specific DNA recombinase
MNSSELIQPRHLQRRAMIYIRQSSPSQVTTNLESQKMQYGLRDRAIALGWHENDVEVIDADLGRSGATTDGRLGFQELVAQIALGEVGILIAFDATRLARNCTHWYLGLKGQISELELHTIRARLTAGILSKAERGELELVLPTGLERLEPGIVVKHPSPEVQQRIELIFSTLLERRSVSQTVRWFLSQELLLPRRTTCGDILWKRATAGNISSIVNNPAYAGAAVYGRTRWKRSEKTGKMQGCNLPPQQWRYCVHDKFPAYITWETFEKIQAMLHDNYSEYSRNKTRGVPRDGKALLHGIMYCGQCGHKMCVQYKGGTRYICNHLKQQTAAPTCQYIGGDTIDDQVVAWFFETLSVAEIDAAGDILSAADTDHAKVLHARQQHVDRLRYESNLAQRQFLKSDPENRLVAGELERRWETSLRELQGAETMLARDQQIAPTYIIPADLMEILRDVGPRLPELWNVGLLKTAQKKSLLRCMIDKVVMHRLAPDQIQLRVVWRGGATTQSNVAVNVGSFADLSAAKEMEETIERMAREGQSDQAIADQLTSQGHRSPMAATVLVSTVRNVRISKGILQRQSQSHPRRVAGFLTIPQLAEKLGVSRSWIHDRIRAGTIKVEKDAKAKCYLFPDTPEILAELRSIITVLKKKLGCRKGHQDE